MLRFIILTATRTAINVQTLPRLHTHREVIPFVWESRNNRRRRVGDSVGTASGGHSSSARTLQHSGISDAPLEKSRRTKSRKQHAFKQFRHCFWANTTQNQVCGPPSVRLFRARSQRKSDKRLYNSNTRVSLSDYPWLISCQFLSASLIDYSLVEERVVFNSRP